MIIASIYELSEDFKAVSELADTAETEEELQVINDTLDAIAGELDVKLENSAKFIKNLDADIDGLDKEIKRLTLIKKRKAALIERLKLNCDNAMKLNNETTKKAGTFTFSYRKSEKTIVDDVNKLPLELRKVEYKPMTAEIKKYIKEHGSVDGARIEVCMNLQIK